MLHHHTVAEQTWWRRKTGRVAGKRYTRAVSESLHGFHKVDVSDLVDREEKRRLKTWGAMKNGPWTEPLFTLLHVGNEQALSVPFSLWSVLLQDGVSCDWLYVVTERQTTQTESDNKTCWLERHPGRLYLILCFAPLWRSDDFFPDKHWDSISDPVIFC